MVNVFIKTYTHAGQWIYNGYASAWEQLGYNVQRYTDGVSNEDLKDSILMTADADLEVTDGLIELLGTCKHVFVFVAPNYFPDPWGTHPNYVNKVSTNQELVSKLNELSNATFWTFLKTDNNDYYKWWNKVEYVPLAFDSINYNTDPIEEKIYDVCYVGGWADNGFNSKKKIMKEIFSEFMKSDLKCGFFINKGLTNEEEARIIKSSKVCLNIHDDYQKILGLDLNERVFKTLGLNGCVVLDYGEHNKLAKEIARYVPVPPTDDVNDLVRLSKVEGLEDHWEINRKEVALNHTYVSRVKQMIGYME